MTPQRAALLIGAQALARHQSLSEGLRGLGEPIAQSAAQALDAGKLEQALRLLGLSPSLSALVAKWPSALGPALRRFDRLPSSTPFRLHLGVTLAYLSLVLFVQQALSSVFIKKVFPVFSAMGGSGLVFADLLEALGGLQCCLVPVIVWLLFGASGWARLPGWGRHYARAEQYAQLAALIESGAPADVRAQVLPRSAMLLQRTPSLAELEELFVDSCARAERASQRFLIALRVGGLTFLTALALLLSLALYTTISRLPGGV